MPKKDKKPKPKRLTLGWVRKQAEILKELGEALQALMGRKPISSKVQVLANPENPLSMSILTKGQARFIALVYYITSVQEWAGHFDGFKDYAQQILAVSPSIEGIGREQVIRFVGAMGESKILERLGLTVKGKEEKE